jgi:hypothetical protein
MAVLGLAAVYPSSGASYEGATNNILGVKQKLKIGMSS